MNRSDKRSISWTAAKTEGRIRRENIFLSRLRRMPLQNRIFASALPLSLALHVLIGIALGTLTLPKPVEPPPPRTLSVDIVPRLPLAKPPDQEPVGKLAPEIPAPAESKAAPAGAKLQDRAPSRPPQAAALAAPNIPAMIRATRILSGATLNLAASRQARLALPTLVPQDRREQLCGLEAMEQIHFWKETFRPTRVVAYATADTKVVGNSVVATGAAFRSARKWYHLEFKCTVANDLKTVIAFEFRVKRPIPRSRWEALNLPEIH